MYRRAYGANEGEPVSNMPEYTPLIAGLLGGTIALFAGRERTRFDNFVIGGLFAGFAAWRDPRATMLSTLVVAGIEGGIWGVTDRLVPELKEAVMPSHPPPGQEAAVAGY